MWASAERRCQSIREGFCITISRSAKEKLRKWFPGTTGTAVIDPTDFEFDKKHYQLELRRSDKLGKLKENELVIWKANPPS